MQHIHIHKPDPDGPYVETVFNDGTAGCVLTGLIYPNNDRHAQPVDGICGTQGGFQCTAPEHCKFEMITLPDDAFICFCACGQESHGATP